MFFAHSIEGQNTDKWQPLDAHLEEVSRLASSRAQKFGAGRLGGLIGLLHDLGKYAQEFQDYIAGQGSSPDHATAGAREIQKLAAAYGKSGYHETITMFWLEMVRRFFAEAAGSESMLSLANRLALGR